MARKRRIATLVMGLGLFASGATLGFGRVQHWRASRLLSTLQTQCEGERKVFWKSSAEEPLPPEAIPASQYQEKPGRLGLTTPPTGPTPPAVEIDPSEVDPYIAGPITTPPPGTVEVPDWDLPDELLPAGLQCVPKDIEENSGYLAGYHDAAGNPPLMEIQTNIHEHVLARDHEWDNAKSCSPLVALALAIPWGWYFLLGRIEELISVIRDTDPRGE